MLQDCRSAGADGWDGVWRCDHCIRPSGERPGYFLECWVSIAAIAAQIPRITVGSLVSPTSLRHPGQLAITAATVQQISQGRLVLGIGAGGDAEEHAALGVPFLPDADRITVLAEACAAIRGLLSPGPADFSGSHYRLRLGDTGLSGSPRVPILVGAAGPHGIDVAARYADMWAVWGTPSELAAGCRMLDESCQRYGRDPLEVRRAAIVMLDAGGQSGSWPAALSTDSGKVRDALSLYRDINVGELIICDFALPRTARSAILRQLRGDALAWSDEMDGLWRQPTASESALASWPTMKSA